MVETKRDRGAWTDAKQAHLDLVIEVLDDLREYWPLTLRQIFYQLVARELIPNEHGQYKKLSRILSQARIEERLTWKTMEDRAREWLESGGWADESEFVRQEKENFLRGYRRDLLTGQPWLPEIWIEKDALSRIAHNAAFEFCVPVVVAKGFSSVSFLHDCRTRIEDAIENGSEGLRILYFGDLDPSGWNMLPAMLETLQEEMGLGGRVEGIRCGLTPAQVAEYQLPHSVEAIKETDSRTPRYRSWLRDQFIENDLAVELDALAPATLQGLVRQSIEASLDIDEFRRQKQIEEVERVELEEYRQIALAALDDAEGGL